MFDMCSSYCENFIYIYLSIAMWHGIFDELTNNQSAISAQKVNSLKHYTNKQGRWIHHFLERKSTLAEQYLAWTTVLYNKKVERSSSCLKRVKNSLERLKTYSLKRVKLQNYPLQNQSHPFEQMERSALS